MPEKGNITYEILEHLGVIARHDSGWTKELNIISWNGGAAKYDIREWDAYHERMKRGITLFDSELRKLVELYLNNNTQKAVERGRLLEEQRSARRREQRDRKAAEGAAGVAEQGDVKDPTATAVPFDVAALSAEAAGEALPPAGEPIPEGQELGMLCEESLTGSETGDQERSATSDFSDAGDETPF